MPVSPASTLPDELLSMVFDYVVLEDLVRLSRVCRHWRSVARAHRTFWKDIEVVGPTKRDMALFSARLGSTNNVGVRVVVFLINHPGFAHRAARKSVLAAITANLARIAYLHLGFAPEHAVEALAALRNPAPALKRLILGGMCDTGASRVPRSLLAGSCPSLTYVQLVGLSLPLRPTRAFSQVKRLQYTVTEHASLSTNLFQHFPALKVLDIFCTGAYDGTKLIAQFERAPKLDALDIDSDNNDLHALFVACPGLCSIPTIQFSYEKDLLDLLARRLPGPLGLEVTTSMDVTFTVASHSRGWRRTCKISNVSPCGQPRRTDLPGPSFYACKAIGHRITTLTLDVSRASMCYRVASLIGALPLCETLEISVSRFLDTPDGHRGNPIPLPALTRVVVRPKPGETSVTVRAKTLAHFLQDLIGRQTPRLPLELTGVSLAGDYTHLEADYIFLADVLL